MASPSITRYSDAELEEFRQMILDRFNKAKTELDDLRAEILDITENLSGDFGNDYVDDSSVVGDLELLNNMSIRKRKYLQDLENALIRIKNKTYGVCVVTGTLIDKARLKAVPTTTKSVQGKQMEQLPPPAAPERVTIDLDAEDEEGPQLRHSSPAPEKKIITRIIRKSVTPPSTPRSHDDDEEDDLFIDDDLVDRLRLESDEDDEDEGEDRHDAPSDEPFDFDSVAAAD